MQLPQVSAFISVSPEQRKLVYNALVNNAIEGWTPTVESVALLRESVAGTISFDEYRNRVLARIASGSNHRQRSTDCGGAVGDRLLR
jgi:Antitoxin VbhA